MRRIVTGMLLTLTAFAQEPQFTKDGKLIKPKDYREWIWVSSGLGMTYGPADAGSERNPQFDNVFVSRTAYKSFLDTGKWPEKTMFVLEVRGAESKGSINNGGHYQGSDFRLSAEVKDSSRFASLGSGGWQFFSLPANGEPGDALPKSAGCIACHSKNGAVDNTFVQFYPTLLPIAKSKGTFKATGEK
jgi:hypothetical protein